MRRFILAIACSTAVLAAGGRRLPEPPDPPTQPVERRMSFHNRLLLNRCVLAGLQSMEVLLLARLEGDPAGSLREVSAAVFRVGGRVVKTAAEIGYLRVELPPDRLLELVASRAVAAYQISSFSLGTWYRDGPPLANATLQRSFETTPIAPAEPSHDHSHLPTLTHEESRAPGFTAEDGAGVGVWMRSHPTFDGRGVTIALVESALPSFADPVFRTAKTLDGRDVPKIAGILNAIDPASEDETRVRLDMPLETEKRWARVGNRTYILPRPGTYRLGVLEVPAGGNVIHRFAVIEEAATRNVWIDSNGDASFQDETPLADVNERFEPRLLKLTVPRKIDVSFVMGRAPEPHVVHIYMGKSGHQTMTASVAAGNITADSLASGVAPGARLLFVRISSPNVGGLARIVEGFMLAAQRPDVDVISASTPVAMVPDTSSDFVGLFLTRLAATYGKPILNGAGNYGLMLGQLHANGGALSVGGIQSHATFNAMYGGGRLDRTIVHIMSAAGPALDGAVKPDFLAPMERISASLPWLVDMEAAPQNAPERRVPPGYGISCCTSASSPYAAGVVALLISAARQSNVPFSLATLTRALRVTARIVPGFQAHEQGNGALDVNGAWRALVEPYTPPRIAASATIVHPLAEYSARGREGRGILESIGWKAGARGTRTIRLRRESGPAGPTSYRLAWTADDGTFSTPSFVTLPLGKTVEVPVSIHVRDSGAHSGLLTLHEAATGAVVFRTQATIVAPEAFDPATRTVEMSSTVGLMRANAHYLDVPAGIGAIALELEVKRGVVTPTVLQAHGLPNQYYMHVHPMDTFFLGPGTYRILLPDPEPGTWTVRVKNGSSFFHPRHQLGPRDVVDAEYTVRARILASGMRAVRSDDGGMTLDLANEGSRIAEPVIEVWPASLRSHRVAFARNGLSNLIEIEVPADAAALALRLRSNGEAMTELFLYDCTSGQCFSYDIAFPAATSQRLLVRKPAQGLWVAAVNAAPFPAPVGSFVLDEVITAGVPVRRTTGTPRVPGARWREVFADLPAAPVREGATPALFVQLLDAAVEREEIRHPWSTASHFVKLRDRPVALGTVVYPR